MFWLIAILGLTLAFLSVRLMQLNATKRSQAFEIKELTEENEILNEALKLANKRLKTTKYF